jgi:CheY-like chemotaxis protein
MKGVVVSAQYKKADNLDDKIKEMQLPYFQWKVLFMVSEDVTVDEMSTTLDEKKEDIEAALEALHSSGLIEPAVQSEEPQHEEETGIEEKLTETEGEEVFEEESEEEFIPTVEEEEDEKDIDIQEMETEEDLETEEEPSEKLTEDDIASSLKEKEEHEREETPESAIAEEAEKSEVGEFLEGVNELPDTADTETAETTVAEEKETAEPVKEEFISDVSKKTIMVIDDSIVIRKMIEIALEEEDLRIITATSGKEGMESIEKNEPNLIILDMLLPDMNGIDLLKKIKEGKDTPVIMLSGKDSPQLVENAKEIGVDDFLPKPFRDEELVEKVKNLLS